jgi:hypothetical protein
MEEELNTPNDELEDIPTEDESGTDELDGTFTLELETSDELEDLTVEDELNCPLLEENSTEDELYPSDSELLFPLSPPQDMRIRAAATIPRNAIRCFCFIFLLLTLNHQLS